MASTIFYKGNNPEVFCMQVSLWGCALIAIYGLIAGLMCRSSTILVDAIIASVETLTSYWTLKVSENLLAPPTSDFQYGFFKFEPAIINLESTLAICTSAIGIIYAFRDILHPTGGVDLNLDIALSYTYFSTAVTLFVTALLFYYYKREKSELIKTNATYWGMDIITALGIMLGFFIATALKYSAHYHQYAIYVDPIMTIGLSLLLMKEPIGLYGESCKDLLDASPDKEVESAIRKTIDETLKIHPDAENYTYSLMIRRAGRKIVLAINYKLAKNRTDTYDLHNTLQEALHKNHPAVMVFFMHSENNDLHKAES